MNHISRAIETTGTVEEGRRITLDRPLPEIGHGRVRIIVLLDEEVDVDDDEWLRAASANPAYAFLADEPDLYTLADGKPFHDEG